MHAQLIRLLTVTGICVQLWACGSGGVPDVDLRQENVQGLDAFGRGKVDLFFNLPDREVLVAEYPAIRERMNMYHYRLEGSGKNCPADEVLEAAGEFEDYKAISLKVNGACSYAVTLRVGHTEAAALELVAPVNWDNDIKPLMEAHCGSCPPAYMTYEGFLANADQAMLDIENGLLPAEAPFSDAQIATFLAWQDGGYIEHDPTPAPSAEALKLDSVFYQNNSNDILHDHELLGRTYIQLARQLWIQPAGEAEGLSTKQLLTFKVNGEDEP